MSAGRRIGEPSGPEEPVEGWGFTSMINWFKKREADLADSLEAIAAAASAATPGEFLLLQFEMASVTQMGDSIANLMAQLNNLIANSIRNLKQ